MRIVLSSISFLASTIAGYMFAARTSSGYAEIKKLSQAFSVFRYHITVYKEGLTEAIRKSKADEKSELFSEILLLARSGKNDVFSEAIDSSGYSDEIKSSLAFLFSKIRDADCRTINEAFDHAAKLITDEENRLKEKAKRDAPLYRKAGIISGIAAAILLL